MDLGLLDGIEKGLGPIKLKNCFQTSPWDVWVGCLHATNHYLEAPCNAEWAAIDTVKSYRGEVESVVYYYKFS